MQSIKKQPGYLYCFGEHYCDVYMVIYYGVKGFTKESIPHLLNVNYESKTIKIS